MKAWFLDKSILISSLAYQDQMDAGKLLTQQGKDYVDVHYHEADLTADHISAVLHVSPGYLSTVFKREMKILNIALNI